MLFMNRNGIHHVIARLTLSLMLGGLCAFAVPAPAASAGPAADRTVLSQRRAQQRDRMRAMNLAKDTQASPAPFGLLVIPVDFQDARLASAWRPTDLSARLTAPSGESLRQYFDVASVGQLELRITLAPLVRLAGTRRDYSDIGLNGFTRTRKLASEALTVVRDLGVEFRRLDMDGPDGIAGTSDDDGEIDGILILHAGIGQENDPVGGLIQPLQFFLEEPVIADGVAAVSYAVASMSSGPGIWAHETGHLLGLEDRYDPLLSGAGSEIQSRGGLGRFSLMASGAWGTGDGYGAALPDAYSCAQLGWYRPRNLPGTAGLTTAMAPAVLAGDAVRVWSRGAAGHEFFLLECRDSAAAFPFDAALPANQLIVYHIDESLPEGAWSDDGPGQYHLRTRLVEADADDRLAAGLDDGRAEDLFPGPLGVTSFGPSTVPASDGYLAPTEVVLSGITSTASGVTFTAANAADKSVEFSFGFSGDGVQTLDLVVIATGTPLAAPRALIAIASTPAWGTFAAGQMSVDVALALDVSGRWVPAEPVTWLPTGGVPDAAATVFSVRVTDPGYDSGALGRTWYWKANAATLDFAATWPGQWVVDHPAGNFETTWHRWDAGPWLTADQTTVLACTGTSHPTAAAWPDVLYGNRAYTTLTSGPLGPEVRGVRLVHALDVEVLSGTTAMDGGLVSWVGSDGTVVPARPVDGWPGVIATQSLNPLHGRETFIQKELELVQDMPLWRTDLIPVPTEGSGPWQLRLEFAANTLNRRRGWFISRIDPLFSEPATSAFPVRWQSGLTWDWPGSGSGVRRFTVQGLADDQAAWADIAAEDFSPDPADGSYHLSADRILAALAGPRRQRQVLRVTGYDTYGALATRAVVVFADGGDGQTVSLGRPWPNPAVGTIRMLVEIPVARTGQLSILDLRGRLLLHRSFPAGSHVFVWDGHDDAGRRAASGSYFIRLEGSGPVTTRKVVLLH